MPDVSRIRRRSLPYRVRTTTRAARSGGASYGDRARAALAALAGQLAQEPAGVHRRKLTGFTRPEGDACDAGAIEGVVNALDVPALSGWGVAVLVLMVGGAAVSLLRAQSPPVSSRSP
jgi:hypothetical protein